MILGIALLVCLAAFGFSATPDQSIFDTQIAPVVAKHCAGCHSASQASSGLSLASLASTLQGGKHGPAIVPGRSASSPLIQYVRGDKQPKMPLGGSLDAASIDALAKAIDSMKPAASGAGPDPYFSWLFNAPKPPQPPAVKRADWVINPIDAFVLAKLEEKGIAPAPAADKRALIRRVYFDLIGLPPTPDEVATFVDDKSPEAYEKVINRLLKDPRYGERWARHWLDLVRFAESDGFAIDGERPTAWRYRDYVIRAFNNDKPYDEFVKEQISGDEMKNPADRSDAVVALGFLRMAPWEADANFKTQLRQDFLNEVTATTSSVFLGLTAGCARCHDHKYDPIPSRDFYRLQAFFAATKVDERPAGHNKAEDPDRAMRKRLRQLEADAEAAAEELQKLEEKLKPKAPKDFARIIKDKKNTTFTDAERAEYIATRDRSTRLNEFASRHRPVAYAVSDVTPPQVPAIADTYVLAGGELANKGEKVDPGFLTCLTGKPESAKIPFAGGSSGRRTALAEWIASPSNPLTARVMANRLWQHHLAQGLIRTASDFGKNGERATHPELLDWLATQFTANKWSIKAMHRLILLSNTYRQSTSHPDSEKLSAADPDNKLLWRANWLRLESETLRDSILSVSGLLKGRTGGPGVFLDVPADVAEGFEFFKWFPSTPEDQQVRTVYTFQRRSVVMPMMEVFDAANMAESCARRNTTVVPPQAFALLNSRFTNAAANAFANRVKQAAGDNKDRQIDWAFRLALARPPSDSELKTARSAGLSQLALVLFNVNEFLYLD